jgi:hypothetical protein
MHCILLLLLPPLLLRSVLLPLQHSIGFGNLQWLLQHMLMLSSACSCPLLLCCQYGMRLSLPPPTCLHAVSGCVPAMHPLTVGFLLLVPVPAISAIFVAPGCSGTPASAGFTLPANAEWACGASNTPVGSSCTAQCASGYNVAGGPWTSACGSGPAWQAPTGTPITSCTLIGEHAGTANAPCTTHRCMRLSNQHEKRQPHVQQSWRRRLQSSADCCMSVSCCLQCLPMFIPAAVAPLQCGHGDAWSY